MKKLLPLILLLACRVATAQVVVDTTNVSIYAPPSGMTLAAMATVGVTDNMILAMCSRWNNAAIFSSTPTFAGMNMTQAYAQVGVGLSGNQTQEGWYLANPPFGPGTFSATTSSDVSGGTMACVFVPMSGVASSGAFGTPAYGASATGTTGSATASGVSANGLYLGQGFFEQTSIANGGAPMVSVFISNNTNGRGGSISSDSIAAGNPGAFSYTGTGGANVGWAVVAIAVNAATVAANSGPVIIGGNPVIFSGNPVIFAPSGSLAFSTTSLPTATVGTNYTPAIPLATLVCTGGSGSGYWYMKVSGRPSTMLWDQVTPTGQIIGQPEAAETSGNTYECGDSAGHHVQTALNLTSAAIGTLTINTSATLPSSTNGGLYAIPVSISGGTPPYSCAPYPTPTNSNLPPYQISVDCWINGNPTATGTTTFTANLVVTDDVGNMAVLGTPAVTATNALQLFGIDQPSGVVRVPAAKAGQYWWYHTQGYGGTPPYTCTFTGLPAWVTASGCFVSGTPTNPHADQITISITDSAGSPATVMANAYLNVQDNANVARPLYNTSSAFYVAPDVNGYGRIYSPDGYPFECYGMDRNHVDNNQWTIGGLRANGALTYLNCERILALEDTPAVPKTANYLPAEAINQNIFPIVSDFGAYLAGGSGTYVAASNLTTTATGTTVTSNVMTTTDANVSGSAITVGQGVSGGTLSGDTYILSAAGTGSGTHLWNLVSACNQAGVSGCHAPPNQGSFTASLKSHQFQVSSYAFGAGQFGVNAGLTALSTPGPPADAAITNTCGAGCFVVYGNVTSGTTSQFTVVDPHGVTGNTTVESLVGALNWWVWNEPEFITYDNQAGWNIANEWGDNLGAGNTTTTWANAYTAVMNTGGTAYPVFSITGTNVIQLGASVTGSNPFANSSIIYIDGASCAQTPVVATITATGGTSGAYTVSVVAATLTNTASSTTCFVVGGAVGTMRRVGYTGPLVIDTLSFGEDITAYVDGTAAAIEASDPEKNVVFDNHFYGASVVQGTISGISNAANGVITFNWNGATNPFTDQACNPTNCQFIVLGQTGMTQINGLILTRSGGAGSCSGGHCTLTTTTNTSGFSTANATGIVYDYRNYQMLMTQVRTFNALGYASIIGEWSNPATESPTLTPGIAAFLAGTRAYQIGTMYWAWDDGSGWNANCFCASVNGQYTLALPSDLGANGMNLVGNPRVGMQTKAIPANTLHP